MTIGEDRGGGPGDSGVLSHLKDLTRSQIVPNLKAIIFKMVKVRKSDNILASSEDTTGEILQVRKSGSTPTH
ncbi:hypothetical protein N7523_003415 [Penicillium sp. IBT 18751x]|nr:hypothetical protein N7523_003415 [Penicillium sp. IBT 18751x]